MPGDYSQTFSSCQGDAAEYPGIYGSSTFQQVSRLAVFRTISLLTIIIWKLGSTLHPGSSRASRYFSMLLRG
jgi:hypothetical protein